MESAAHKTKHFETLVHQYDASQPMTLAKVKEIFMKYFYEDDYENSVSFMRHVNTLIRKSLLTSDDGTALSIEDPSVKEFLESNEFKAIKQEKELFDQYF